MKSTLKWAIVLLAFLCVPEMAFAAKRTVKTDKPTCDPLQDGIGCAGNTVAFDHKVPGVQYSSSSSSGDFVGGWMCPHRGDEFDQYRIVQNKSARKQADTFITNSAIGAANPVASAVMTNLSPASLISLLVNVFNFGNNYSNLQAQQKIACENLELRIEEIKKQRGMIVKNGQDARNQIQDVANDLRQQIPHVVDERFRQWVPKFVQELEKAGYQIVPPVQTESEKLGPPVPSDAAPEVKPEVPKEKSSPSPVPSAPSVSAPEPQPITPSRYSPPVQHIVENAENIKK